MKAQASRMRLRVAEWMSRLRDGCPLEPGRQVNYTVCAVWASGVHMEVFELILIMLACVIASAILDQVTNGVAVRMAALWCVLTRSKENASAS